MGARILIGAFGDAGHAFPAIGLARALVTAGHEVTLESWERWREDTEHVGARFEAAQQYVVFPTQQEIASAAQAAQAMLPLLDESQPELVISDVLTLATSLAAELRGVPRATLVPHVYPVTERWMPFFSLGAPPPRSTAGRLLWRGLQPAIGIGLRKGRTQLNEQRAQLGLAPIERMHGGMSETLVMVGTLPQLEYPRNWGPHARVIGPIGYERPHPDVELPVGDDPIVLVAPSTAKDPGGGLIRKAFEALAEEPVRVIATTNAHVSEEPIDVPPNARLVDWLSYSQVMPLTSLVIAHGGHGTVCRALGHGVPIVATPIAGDMFETGARLQWAGVGRSVPWRACTPRTLRWVVRAVLRDPVYRKRATAIAGWLNENDPDQMAVEAVESVL